MPKKKTITLKDIPPDMRKTAQDEAAWLLSLPAVGDNGGNVSYGGRDLTNLGVLMLGLMQTAQENPTAAMTMFTLGGVLKDHDSVPTDAERERQKKAHKARMVKVTKASQVIRDQLKKAGVWSPGLSTMVTAVATARVQLDVIADRAFEMEPFVVELSREGAKRVKSNPVVDDFMRFSQQLTTLSSQLIHRAIQLSGKASSDDEKKLIDTLREINDVSKYEKMDATGDDESED